VTCSTCGKPLEEADPKPNDELEPLLSGHCRFCHQAADFTRFLSARTHRGGPEFQPWQLILLSQWLRLTAAQSLRQATR
jgi:hypothetical protein